MSGETASAFGSWILACVLISPAARADVITFEDQAVGTNITTQYQAQGVVFSSVPNPGSGNTATISSFAIFGLRSLGPGGPPPVFGGTLIMHFSPLVTVAGSWVLDDQSVINVTAYDAGNTPVGSVMLNGLATPAEFWSLSHSAGIARIEMVPLSVTDGWVIDDLTFTPIPACYPDCNGSGTLTVADFTCFQGEFLNQTPYGDCNESGTWTVSDFTCFQIAFVAGCP